MNNTSDVWLNIEEVCSLTNSKRETIRRKCKSGEYKCRFEFAGRKKNYQILLSSMPLQYIEKYKSYVTLPNKDTWEVLMQKNSPLADKKSITKEDLLNVPLIVSKQVMQRKNVKNDYNMWFGSYIDRLNIVATYNLIYNAAKMTEVGVGYSIGLKNLINTTGKSNLCFRPLNPKLESGLDIV